MRIDTFQGHCSSSCFALWRSCLVRVPSPAKLARKRKRSVIQLSTPSSCRHYSNTAKNFSVWRINNKSSSRKLAREDFLCPRFFPVRRRSSMRKPLRWPTRTAGSSTWKRHFQSKLSLRTSRTFSSSQRLSQTSVLISISSRPWPSSPLKYSRKPSTHLNWWSLKKKSTGFSGQTLSISPNASCTRTVLRDRSQLLRTSRCHSFNRRLRPWSLAQLWAQSCLKKSQQNSSNAQKCQSKFSFWFWPLIFIGMPSVWSSNATSLKSVHSIKRWILAALWIVDLQWSVSFSPVWKTRLRCSRKNPRRRSRWELPPPSTSSAASSRRWLKQRHASVMPATGTSD